MRPVTIPLRSLAFCIGLVLVFLSGVAIRHTVLEAQYKRHGRDMPFTLESALHYSLLEAYDLLGYMPRHEYGIQYPEGVDLWETYSVGSEYVVAPLAGLLPGSLSFAERVRLVYILWFSLGIPFFALWVWALSGSRLGGLASALLYGVCTAAVIRSTGQEISRENFAIPLLVGHLAAAAWTGRGVGGRKKILLEVTSALLLAVALVTWDMIQFYLVFWAGAGLVGVLRARSVSRSFLVHAGVLVAVGWVNPYLRTHGFLQSPTMLMAYGAVLASLATKLTLGNSGRERGLRWALALGPVVVGLVLAQLYSSHYGHFADLLWAKLRFLNEKPEDPLLLNFNQRIMWVPALDSATWRLTSLLFPVLWLPTLAAGVFVLVRRGLRRQPGVALLLLLFVSSLLAYVLFVRFHVYLALFSVALVGVTFGGMGRWGRGIAAGIVGLVALAETSITVKDPLSLGRGNVYYRELKGLTEWMAEHAAPEAVAANFTVSGPIFAYAGCPVVMHPKFETQSIRDRVQSYVEALYTGTEEDFRNWMEAHGARYYVHSMGEFSPQSPEQQMRYFAGMLDPPESSPARLFEFRPEQGRWFHFVWGNHKYRVFRVQFARDIELAQDSLELARDAFERGQLDEAEFRAREAIQLDPGEQEAFRILGHAERLRAMGFGGASADEHEER